MIKFSGNVVNKNVKKGRPTIETCDTPDNAKKGDENLPMMRIQGLFKK
jgi:hypothetical protein